MNKSNEKLPLSGLGIQVSPRYTRSKTSGNPSRQEAGRSNLKYIVCKQSSIFKTFQTWRGRLEK